VKSYLILILIFTIIFLTSCNKDNNPVSDNNNIIDWEGNSPLVNTDCNDSVLFSSDRYIGTNFAPSVYIMHKGGTGIHALTNGVFTFGASWSPRRWKIIFIADSGYGPPSRGLYIMNSDGTNIKRLTSSDEDVFGSAVWSPDGSKIAYVEIDAYGLGRVKIINPDGTDAKVLTDWFGGLRCVTWLPNSRSIIFDGFENMSIHKLHIINSDGTGLSELFEYYYGCYSPSCSPNGTLVAFCSSAFNYTQIFTYNINTKEIKLITKSNNFHDRPTWSPDSKSILYSSRPPSQSGGSSIYSIGIDGSNLVRLTDSLGTDYDVSWFK
jgi:Tol biopolymer transport system component